MKCLKKPALLKIGNVLGKAIKMDMVSAEAVQGKYARVCIELNLNKLLVPNIVVMG